MQRDVLYCSAQCYVRYPQATHVRVHITRARVREHSNTRTDARAAHGGTGHGRYDHAWRAVVRLFCDELQLAAHFAALRRYVLMHAGELLDCLSAELRKVHRAHTHTRACTRTHVVRAQAAHGWQSPQALRLCLQVTHARAADSSLVHNHARANANAHTHKHTHGHTHARMRTHAIQRVCIFTPR
jgi:hypothetical protein